MKVLSRTISEKTEIILKAICDSVHLPIEYYPLNNRPNIRDSVAGTVDPHGQNGIYSVWLDETLPQDAFEADLLHETHHIVQIEAGFSEIYNKDTKEFHSKDRAFVEEVGSHLSSVILDMEVNSWLGKNGYSYSFFSEGNLSNLIAHSNYKYTGLADPLNFGNLAHALLQTSLYVNDAAADRLFSAYSAYPKVITCVASLRKRLLMTKIDNPMESLFAHGLVLDSLGLWRFYYAATPTRKIRTHGEFLILAEETGFQEDILE